MLWMLHKDSMLLREMWNEREWVPRGNLCQEMVTIALWHVEFRLDLYCVAFEERRVRKRYTKQEVKLKVINTAKLVLLWLLSLRGCKWNQINSKCKIPLHSFGKILCQAVTEIFFLMKAKSFLCGKVILEMEKYRRQNKGKVKGIFF